MQDVLHEQRVDAKGGQDGLRQGVLVARHVDPPQLGRPATGRRQPLARGLVLGQRGPRRFLVPTPVTPKLSPG